MPATPTPRGVAVAIAEYLPEPDDARAVLAATFRTASAETRAAALMALAGNHADVPNDLQDHLVAYICRQVRQPGRSYLYTELCQLADDIYGLANVGGYADRWREEDEPPLDPQALIEVYREDARLTLREMTTPRKATA